LAATPATAAANVARPQRAASGVAEAFTRLGDGARWTRVGEVRLNFRTYHPQGMVKVGNEYWMSSVEVKGGWLARVLHLLHLAPEKGVGHLFRFDQQGKLLGDLKLGDGAMYHAGGIDFDGQYLWIPVAEYRANSQALIYKVDPTTMKAEVAFQFPDHLGAVARNPDDNTLHAVSWNAEKLYTWQLDDPGAAPKMTYNDGRSVDYQDMHHLGNNLVLASGYRGLTGGIDLVDLKTRMPVHQVRVPMRVGALPITRNPFFCEQVGQKLQFTFVPQDNQSSMFVYEVEP
jgi:hypothetical protein